MKIFVCPAGSSSDARSARATPGIESRARMRTAARHIRSFNERAVRNLAFAAALPGFVMLGGGHSQLAVGGLPPGASLSSVAAVGANTVLLSAEGSAAVWLVHRDHNGRLSLSGCVRPQLQHHCAPSSGSQRLNAAPLVLAGRDVYVADGRHGVLARYRRSGTRLRYVAALHEASLRGALRMVLVNRRRILAVGTDRGSVRLFERGEGGDLTATGCVGGPGSTTCKPLAAQAPGLWMAGAGNWLFTAGGDSITSFSARLRPTRGACVTDAGSEFAEVDSLPGCTFDQHAAGDEFFGMTLFATDSVLYSTDFTTGGIGLGIGWWRIGQSGSPAVGGWPGAG